jgi:hypothetical protein
MFRVASRLFSSRKVLSWAWTRFLLFPYAELDLGRPVLGHQLLHPTTEAKSVPRSGVCQQAAGAQLWMRRAASDIAFRINPEAYPTDLPPDG